MSGGENRGGASTKQYPTHPPGNPPPYYPRHAPPHYTTQAPTDHHKASYPVIPKLSDDEWLRRGTRELLKFLRKAEMELSKMSLEHSRINKEMERRIQQGLIDTRNIKEVNKRLQDDNQELRDLCCFLDDDRQKGRKLAREWQRFGRYTASVMRQEVQNYQGKLHDLDVRQQQLVRDNLQLKELCVYLDEERICRECGNTNVARDDGDGSSSSTNADESPANQSPTGSTSSSRAARTQNTILNEQILSYIRNLETRVQQLELEKSTNELGQIHRTYNQTQQRDDSSNTSLTGSDTSIPRPESVGRAMKVLEVQENIDLPPPFTQQQPLGDRERAVIREMCNVVWRKLEDAP